MKTTNSHSGLLDSILVLNCLLGGIIFFAPPIQAAVNGKSYNVNVKSSQGKNFTACFEFGNDGSLRFLGLDAIYDGINLGREQKNWQAITKLSSENIALSGRVQDDFISGQSISGNAINSNGTTFTFNGKLISEAQCPSQLINPEENLFLK
ncbi:hypothetical protein [Nostoc sp. MG11]|uniref:hypothetical protein n=1 Tax=Nostoc sp. MG11 TaxID=2721166 RepID=UPI001866AD76|nr:hypothetical protein [Nostoc sp. MG11]